jgi:hypothetical protein
MVSNYPLCFSANKFYPFCGNRKLIPVTSRYHWSMLCVTLRTSHTYILYELCHPRFVCVRTLGSVGSETQLFSLRCNLMTVYWKNNYMFRPMTAIVRLSWEYFRTNCKLYRSHNVEISTCLVSKVWQGTNKTNPKINQNNPKWKLEYMVIKKLHLSDSCVWLPTLPKLPSCL